VLGRGAKISTPKQPTASINNSQSLGMDLILWQEVRKGNWTLDMACARYKGCVVVGQEFIKMDV